MTALGLAALAEAAAPYGIESFDQVLKPLWLGIRLHRGKGLAAFLKAIGFIIPLMDPEYASYYIKEITVILIHEFKTSDEEMKKVLEVRCDRKCHACVYQAGHTARVLQGVLGATYGPRQAKLPTSSGDYGGVSAEGGCIGDRRESC